MKLGTFTEGFAIMKSSPSSQYAYGLLLLLLLLGGCSSGLDLELEVSTSGSEVIFEVKNNTGEPIAANSGLLDTAKIPGGDLRLLVRGPSGEEVPLCSLISSHVPSSVVRIDSGAQLEFRENAALLKSVYCLEELTEASFAVGYGRVEAGSWKFLFQSEFVSLK